MKIPFSSIRPAVPGHASPDAGFEAPFELLTACHERVHRMLRLLDRLQAHLAEKGWDTQAAEAAGRELPGRDIAPALNNLAASELHTVREQILFTYSGIATNDSELTRVISEGRARGVPPKVAVQEAGYRPNLKKRGSLRSIYDGRHKFTRYFSPIERNTPTTLEALKRWNDLELFDLHADPLEKLNLDQVDSVGYGFQVDLAFRVARMGLRIDERPITFVERELGASKMSGNIVVEAMVNVTKWGLQARWNTLTRRKAAGEP